MALLLSVLGFIMTLGVVAMLCVCVYLIYIHNKYSHLPGPPRSSFFLGHLQDMASYVRQVNMIHYYYRDMFEQYGPVFVLFYAHIPRVFFSDPIHVKQIFINNHAVVPKDEVSYSRLAFFSGERALGYGLVTNVNRSSWAQRRQVIAKAFHRQHLKELIIPFNKVTDKLITRLKSCAIDGKEVRMLDEFANATLDAIAVAAFGIDLGAIGDESSPVRRAVVLMQQALEANLYSSLPPWLTSVIYQHSLFQSDLHKRQVEGVRFLRDFARKCISTRIAKLKAGSADTPNDILSYIVRCTEKDATLSIEDLVDEFVTMIFAGHDTTASALACTLFEVISNSEIEEKVLKEANQVIAAKEHLDYDDLPRLKYVDQCILEGLRKYMISGGGPFRDLKKDIVVGGFKIPAGASVAANKFAILRDPSLWENPDIFDPDRFVFPEQIPNYRNIFFPFSIGPRNCVGQRFALFEEKVILARLLQKFKFRLMSGQTAKMEQRITLSITDGVQCTVELR